LPSSPEYDDSRLAVLLEQARQRSRAMRRRQRFRRCIGGSAAIFLIAGLAGGLTAARGGGNTGQQILTAAYVARVQHALASQAGGGLVGYARTVSVPGTVVEPKLGNWETWPGGAGSPRSGLAAAVMIGWSYQSESTATAVGAAGQPVATEQNTAGRHGITTVAVDYRDRTWWRATLALSPGARAPVRRRCLIRGVLPGSETWRSVIRRELSCGVYTEDGRQRVDGIDAIKLTGSDGEVLWIDPGTYLPVRQAVPGAGVTDFRWYRATPASLAKLKLSVPAGFRRVAPPRT